MGGDPPIGDRALLDAVDAASGTVDEVIRFVHEHPELGHEEHACAAYLADVLERAGLEVERGAGGMPTAFRAGLAGGRPGRHVGMVALYDAVPALRPDGTTQAVHSCGHGPLAAGVIAAALALASRREEVAGRVTVFGCPADEIHAPGTIARGGGKALSVEAGLWDDVDVALYAHPEFIDTVSQASLWMRRDRLLVAGRRTLRDDVRCEPLDALAQLTRALDGLPRDRVMLERALVEGDVEEGAGMVLDATVLVFAEDEAGLEAMAQPLRAALSDRRWEPGRTVAGVRPDASATAAVAEAFAAAGGSFVADPPPLPFATDFGNISQRVPAALIGVGRDGGWSFHTDAGAEQFAGPDGARAARGVARVLALSASRLTVAA